MSRLRCIAAAFWLLSCCAARAAETPTATSSTDLPPVAVRVGNHPGYGRIVYEFSAPASYTLSSDAGRVRLEVPDAPVLPTPERLPRNVRAIRAAGTAIELDLVQGAQARAKRIGERIVLDLLDPPRSQPTSSSRSRADRSPPPPASTTQAATPPPAGQSGPTAAPRAPVVPAPQPMPVSGSSPPPSPVPAPPPAPAAGTEQPIRPTPREAVEHDPLVSPVPTAAVEAGPISVAAAPLPAGETGTLLPFPESVGAAAFRRGGQAILVFDTRQPLDLAQLAGDPVLGAAKVELLPAATLVSIPLAAGVPVRLERVPEGWRVQLGGVASPPLPTVKQTGGEVLFGFSAPSRVVVVPDPETRATLLVGTVRPGSGPGAAMTASRRTPSFRIVPAWLGLAVETLSDRVELGIRNDGFALRVPGPALAPETMASATLVNAAALTRVFDFPNLPTDALLRRMEASVAAAAASAPRGRLAARLSAAQAMIALGLGAEAQGLLAATRAENPKAEQDGLAAALQAVTALLGNRPDRADALNDPHLDGSDEITLWRAVAEASASEGSPTAAAAFAATLPLIIAYPQALRDRLLPLAAETMALGGQERAADALLSQFPSDLMLSLARALRLDAEGETGKALALYDALAVDRDRLVRVRAGVRAAELRHRAGQQDAAATADALDRLLAVWRGDQRELALRLRIAELRAQAGQFRPALELLRDTQPLFPAARESIKARMGRVVEALLSGDQSSSLKPLEFIALAGDFADCVPDSTAGDRLATLLASRLVALDLPTQAAPVLERLMRAAPTGAPRARFGLQLAGMRLEGGEPVAALAALRASDAPDLPPSLAEGRSLMLARVQARQGNFPGAVATLATLGTASADELRASLLETAKDWPSALAALRDLAAKRVAATGPLSPEQEEIVLREASAALQAGDAAALLALRQKDGPRMGVGPRADLFHLLTDRPVQSPADLPRAARDVALAQRMSQGLQSLSAQ